MFIFALNILFIFVAIFFKALVILAQCGRPNLSHFLVVKLGCQAIFGLVALINLSTKLEGDIFMLRIPCHFHFESSKRTRSSF